MSKQHGYLCEWLRGQGLGPCCHCMRDGSANLLLLNYAAPISGTGWGCAQCGLPDDGALAVMCDECMEAEKPVLYVCVGRPGAGVRAPAESLRTTFHHRTSRHPERFRADPWDCTEAESLANLLLINEWRRRGNFAGCARMN